MKKTIITIIMMFLIIGIFARNTNAATTNIGASFNKSEQTVSVTVSFSEKVSAAQFKLNYDSNKVTYVSNSAGGQFGEATKRFAYASANPNLTSVTFTFKAKTTGNCGFSVGGLTIKTAQGKVTPTLSNSSTSVNMQPNTSSPTTTQPQNPSTSQTTTSSKPTTSTTNKKTTTNKKATTKKKSTTSKSASQGQTTEEQVAEQEEVEDEQESEDENQEQLEEVKEEIEQNNETQDENTINENTLETEIEDKLNSVTRINMVFRIVIMVLVVVIVMFIIAFIIKKNK